MVRFTIPPAYNSTIQILSYIHIRNMMILDKNMHMECEHYHFNNIFLSVIEHKKLNTRYHFGIEE